MQNEGRSSLPLTGAPFQPTTKVGWWDGGPFIKKGTYKIWSTYLTVTIHGKIQMAHTITEIMRKCTFLRFPKAPSFGCYSTLSTEFCTLRKLCKVHFLCLTQYSLITTGLNFRIIYLISASPFRTLQPGSVICDGRL